MALYLFVSKRDVQTNSRNRCGYDTRMVLRPIANQTTYRSRGRVEELGNRRLQMDINDRTEVCRRGTRDVYALWQPNLTPCSNNTRKGRLSIHTRNGEEMFVYDRYDPVNHPHFQLRTSNFALIRIGTYSGLETAPLLAEHVVRNDNMLEEAFRNRFGNNGSLPEETERLLRSLKDELLSYLLFLRSRGGTATDSHTTVEEQAEATPTTDSDAERNRAITALQTQRLDYSKIPASGHNRSVMFKLLDKLALGIAEFDYYKADGSIRHAKGTRNPYIINEQMGTDDLSSTEESISFEDLNSNPEDCIERIRYYDMERSAYRTFNVGRVIGLSLTT